MLSSATASPRRVVMLLEFTRYGGHVPPWSRVLDSRCNGFAIADGDRHPRPRMQMGSQL
jgi:hypothetical protein